MTRTRPPAVAGTFYPADPQKLSATVRLLLAAASEESAATLPPKAIIAPHAGYAFSGPIAATAYTQLAGLRDQVRRVLLIGPAHRVPVAGLAVSMAEAFATPLGSVPVDTATVERLLALPQVEALEAAHAQEHCLEVHLPFLQEVFGDFAIVPLVVGRATPEEVREVLELVWDDPATLIVVSSDLSHYYDYETARQVDRATAQWIESLDSEQTEGQEACGRVAIGGLLAASRARGLHARTLDLRNSGDTAGPRDSVVGYGAFVVG